MSEPESKLARLVNWVDQNMGRDKAFLKSAFYSFARNNGMERSALVFISRCRQNGTMIDKDGGRIEVLVPKGKGSEQFYRNLLQIKTPPETKPVPRPQESSRPSRFPKQTPHPVPRREAAAETIPHDKAKPLPPQPAPKREPRLQTIGPEHAQRAIPEQEIRQRPAAGGNNRGKPERAERSETEDPLKAVLIFGNALEKRLDEQFRRMEDKVASISGEVSNRIENLEKNISLATVRDLQTRIKQLEKQLEEFREKAEAFDLIKRDAWEVVQALDIVEIERTDVRNILRKFL